jgi:hypothetical protein
LLTGETDNFLAFEKLPCRILASSVATKAGWLSLKGRWLMLEDRRFACRRGSQICHPLQLPGFDQRRSNSDAFDSERLTSQHRRHTNQN